MFRDPAETLVVTKEDVQENKSRSSSLDEASQETGIAPSDSGAEETECGELQEVTVYEEVAEVTDQEGDEEDMDQSSLMHISLENLKCDSEPGESYGQVITLDDEGNPVVYEQEIRMEGERTLNSLKPVPLRRPRAKRVIVTDDNLVCTECGRKFPHISNLRGELNGFVTEI